VLILCVTRHARHALITIFSYLSTDRAAWQATRGFPGHAKTSPLDQLMWATATMKHATSHMHIDAQGLATAIDTLAGARYWVVAHARGMQSAESLASSDLEAVVLTPGTLL
jgi:hypothetical protein